MIRFAKLHYAYPATGWVLKGIDLQIGNGEYVVIYGANGSGKSTLCYLTNGLIPHFFGGTFIGTVRLNHRNTKECRVSDLLPEVGLVLQNCDAHLFNSTVGSEIAFGLESLGLDPSEIDGRIREIAARVKIEKLLARSPTALSGGEKRLVAIASVLCLDPPLLVLDEPYASLDWEGIRRVRSLLERIHRSGKTIIVIEQKTVGFLQDATRCIIMDRGKIVFDGLPGAAGAALSERHLMPHYPKRISRNVQGGKTILQVENLTYQIEDRIVLKHISLEVKQGESIAIIGKNGAGKTTLIKHLNGILGGGSQGVRFGDKLVEKMQPAERASNIGVSFQNPNDQFFKSKVRDEILVGPRIQKRGEDEWIGNVFDMFHLRPLLERAPYQLSEGEKKRVAIASIVSIRPNILVLDEPTLGQDGASREGLLRLLATFEEHRFTIIIVTHDLDFAEAAADRWLVLFDGKLVADGTPSDLRSNRQLIEMGAIENVAVT
jgi:energy-coupling factor transport system ATP-binding protein